MLNKNINVNIMLVTLKSNMRLLEEYAYLDMKSCDENFSYVKRLELKAIKNELLRRGFGNSNNEIEIFKIKGAC